MTGVVALACSGQQAVAQAFRQLEPGIQPGALGCAASANNTGNMNCLGYGSSNNLMAIDWLAGQSTLNFSFSFPAPAGTLFGVPTCVSTGNNTGKATCLVMSLSGQSTVLQGAAFSFVQVPPALPNGPPGFVLQTGGALQTVSVLPSSLNTSNPGCVSTWQTVVPGSPTSGNAIACVFTIVGQLYVVSFDPLTNFMTPLTLLQAGSGFSGTPSCSSAQPSVPTLNIPSVCVVIQNGSLVAFPLNFSFSVGGSATIQAGRMMPINVPGGVSGNPSCVTPWSGQIGTTSFNATCAVVGGSTLYAFTVNPVNPIGPGNPAQLSSFLPLGPPSLGGTWTGSVSCAPVPEFPPNIKFENGLAACVAVSTVGSFGNLFAFSVDPIEGKDFATLPAPIQVDSGPFTRGGSGLSCIGLAIDQNQIFCGATTDADGSDGFQVIVNVQNF